MLELQWELAAKKVHAVPALKQVMKEAENVALDAPGRIEASVVEGKTEGIHFISKLQVMELNVLEASHFVWR